MPGAPVSMGVEVTWWIVDDRILPPPPVAPKAKNSSPGSGEVVKPAPPDHTMPLSTALAPYADAPTPLPTKIRDLWTTHGFDVYSVPPGALSELKARLRIAGPEQRQWIAPTGKWTEIVRGPNARGMQPVQLDTGPIEVSDGAFRLLMRCWPAPGVDGAAVLQTELVPQFVEPRKATEALDPLAPPAPKPSTIEEGVVFQRLFCDLEFRNGEALVLVPRGAEEKVSDPAPPDRPFGPAVAAATTLGQAVLSDALKGGEGQVRLVLVITPTPPERYPRLTP